VLNSVEELNGLAEDLNALLKDASAETAVKLLLTTDTPGVLEVDFAPSTDLSVERVANGRWGGQDKLDVALSALETNEIMMTFPSPSNTPWLVNRIAMEIAGQFPPWRAYTAQSNDLPGKVGMRVNARFSVARRFQFAEAGELFGVALLLRPVTETVEVRVEIVSDKKGQPAPGDPLVTANAAIATGGVGVPRWTSVLFPSSLKVEVHKELWLVVKAKTGDVEWSGLTEIGSTQTTTLFNNEGGQWQRYPLLNGRTPVSQLRILRRPFAQENTPLLEALWPVDGQLLKQEGDLTVTTVQVEFVLPLEQSFLVAPTNGNVAIPVRLVAKADGTVTIKNAKAIYKEQAS